jgi:membrane protease YdiL (CAAX protease family)
VKGSDRLAAKLVILILLGVLAAWWAVALDAGAGDVPLPAAVAGALLLVLGGAGLYEGSSWALAWGISRLRGLGGRSRENPAPPSGMEPGGEEGDAAATRPFGLPGAVAVFLAYVVGNAVVWIVLAVIVAVSAQGRAPGNFETLFLQRAPAWVPWSSVGAALGALVAFRQLSPVSVRALPGVLGVGRVRSVVLGICVGAAVNLAYLSVVPHLPIQPTRLPDSVLWDMLSREGLARWMVLGTAVIIAPVTEEVVFRGLVLEGLGRTLGNAGVLFTLLHVPDTAHYWPATVMILVMGLIAGALRVRTGHIGPAVGVHFGHNAVVALLWAL